MSGVYYATGTAAEVAVIVQLLALVYDVGSVVYLHEGATGIHSICLEVRS